MFTTNTLPPGSHGGLLNAIVGTLIQTALGTLIGTPIGLMVGTYLAEYGRNSPMANAVRFVSDVLLSAPSILIGLFVYQLRVEPFGGFSGIAGCLALAVIVIPIVVRTTEDMLRLIPSTSARGGRSALGAPKWKMIVLICYRAAKDGIVTGMLLAIARIAGETAPLLFTSLGNLNWSLSLAQPMASLPVTIYQYAGSAFEDWVELAWVGALLITVGVLAVNIVARFAARREMTVSTTMSEQQDRQASFGGVQARAARRHERAEDLHPQPGLFLRRQPRAEEHQSGSSGSPGDRHDRPVRLRQVDAAARAEPDVRPVSRSARHRRGDDGRPEHHRPAVDLNALRARIGMVFQKPTPFPMTIYENIAFGVKLHEKLSKSQMDERVEWSLTRGALWVEVKDRLHTSAMGLSGGQQQRLCIARTIAVRPEVILLDEPTSALDPISTLKIEELIDELKHDFTIAIVTHNMQQAARCADQVAFFYLGEMVEVRAGGPVVHGAEGEAHAGLRHRPVRLIQEGHAMSERRNTSSRASIRT